MHRMLTLRREYRTKASLLMYNSYFFPVHTLFDIIILTWPYIIRIEQSFSVSQSFSEATFVPTLWWTNKWMSEWVSEYTIASEWAFNATPITIVVVADFLAVIHIRALNFPPSTTTHYYSLYPAIQSESTPVLSWVVFNKINRRADILQFRFSINRNRYAPSAIERTIQYYEVQHFPFCLILIVELCSFVARMVRQTLHGGRVLCRYCTGKTSKREVRLINY